MIDPTPGSEIPMETEITLLREALSIYGDRIRMATSSRPDLQQVIDLALEANPMSSRALDTTMLKAALEPFATCCEQISVDEVDEEWAKFRLLVGDYRRVKTIYDII